MKSGSVFFWFFPLLPVTTFTVSRKRLLSGSALSQGSAVSTRQANLGGGHEGAGARKEGNTVTAQQCWRKTTFR